VFPFDNRIVRLAVTGAELSRALAEQTDRRGPGSLALSGVQARVSCSPTGATIDLFRPSGPPVDNREELIVATVDSLAAGMFAAAGRRADPVSEPREPLLREVVESWLRNRGGHLRSDELVDRGHPRWEYPDGKPKACGGQ
jgi:5'-nucleotidase, C-terminal domain